MAVNPPQDTNRAHPVHRKRGYEQTPEHIAKRIKSGESHPNWIGDRVSKRGGRTRALRMFSEQQPCNRCGGLPSERHHVDRDPANNDESNIEFLCQPCHAVEHGPLAPREVLVERAKVANAASAANRRSKTHCKNGHEYTPENTFRLSNGGRGCKACRKIHARNYRNKKGAKS